MEVCLTVPIGENIAAVEKEYPDILEIDRDEERGETEYWIGDSPEDLDEGEEEHFTHDEAVEFCGFAEGAIRTGYTMIDGNGPWAQGQLSRRDFSGMAITPEEKADCERISNIWWTAYRRGVLKREFKI